MRTLTDTGPKLFYVEDPWGQYSLRGGADAWTEQLPRLLREAHAGHQYVITSRTDMLGQAKADEGLKRWTVLLDADQYRDGELVERTLPDYLHGKVQGLLFAFFAALRKTLPVHPCVETRMKLRTGLYLIPDVAVFYPTEPDPISENPPLVAIEVSSLDDRLAQGRRIISGC